MSKKVAQNGQSSRSNNNYLHYYLRTACVNIRAGARSILVTTRSFARILMMEAMMSIATSFSSGKQALRRGAFALAAVASLAAATPGQAASFTEHECKVISGVARQVVTALGPNSLSVDFRRSLLGFIAPDGKRSTCTGPTQIRTPTDPDIAAFNTIRGILLQGPSPISLQERGLVSVASLTLN
jgi:hypothetical protein